MTDFVLEVFGEEIPAKMQEDAVKNLAKIASETFARHISFEENQLHCFISPCRISLLFLRLDEFQKLPAIRKIGPKISAPQNAIQGFLRANNLQNADQLEIEGDYYVFNRLENQQKTIEILCELVPQILQKMQNLWQKLMIWNVVDGQEIAKWIRPVRNLLALFGKEILPIQFFGLSAGNISSDKKGRNFVIENARDYRHLLEKNGIEYDQNQRKQSIVFQARQELNRHHLLCPAIESGSNLLSEIAGLCENPKILVGEIDKKFLNLPAEALFVTLQNNQKYLCCTDLNGNFAPKFLFAVDDLGFDEESLQRIAKDNQKVVLARLTDLQFFIEQDLKKPLIHYFQGLDKVIFHQKLGSVAKKIDRIEEMAKFLSIFIPRCDINKITYAAKLTKSDLLTKAVSEMPELQGKIGSFYAKNQGEKPEICAAIYEHYLPIGLNSELPQSPIGIALAMADKIDSILAFHLIGEKPTSSKDPFALRRAALGVIRIAIAYNIAFPIRILIERSFKSFATSLQKLAVSKGENFIEAKNRVVEEVVFFLVERLKFYLKERENLSSQVLNAVIDEYLQNLSSHKLVDILFLVKKTRFIDDLLKNPANSKIIELYKRSANILAAEEKREGMSYYGTPKGSRCKHPSEKMLMKLLLAIKKEFNRKISVADFPSAFEMISQLAKPLDDFFASVLINDKNSDLRQNRLQILAMIREMFDSIGEFSKLDLH